MTPRRPRRRHRRRRRRAGRSGRALLLAREGPAAVRALADAGVPFDRTPTANRPRSRGGAHPSRASSAGGDATGQPGHTALLERAARRCGARHRTLRRRPGGATGRVTGLVALDPATTAGSVHPRQPRGAGAGGIGSLWRETDQSAEATGDGLALAARAGATLADLEFMQFHPTALLRPRAPQPLPLLTEALRGAGAALLDDTGQRFMPRRAPAGRAGAPRRGGARHRPARRRGGEPVFLDASASHCAASAGAFRRRWRCAAQRLRAAREPCRRAGGALPHGRRRHRRARPHRRRRAVGVRRGGLHRRARRQPAGQQLVAGGSGVRPAGGRGYRRARSRRRPVAEAPGRSWPRRRSNRWRQSKRRCAADGAHVGIVRSGEGLAQALAALRDLQDRFVAQCPAAAGYPAADFDAVVRAGALRNMLLVAQLLVPRRCGGRRAAARTTAPTTRTRIRLGRRQVLTLADLGRMRPTRTPRPAISAPC